VIMVPEASPKKGSRTSPAEDTTSQVHWRGAESTTGATAKLAPPRVRVASMKAYPAEGSLTGIAAPVVSVAAVVSKRSSQLNVPAPWRPHAGRFGSVEDWKIDWTVPCASALGAVNPMCAIRIPNTGAAAASAVARHMESEGSHTLLVGV